MRVLRLFASRKITISGFLVLGGCLLLMHYAALTGWLLSVPYTLLAVNLFAAMIVEHRLRKNKGLFIFHLALFMLLVLASLGRLTRLEANLEVVQGGAFSPENLTDVTRGPLHLGSLQALSFMQGSFEVDYAPELQRGQTRSEVFIPDEQGRAKRIIVNDDTPLRLNGYRFYPTSNKGFAAILKWVPEQGMTMKGAVHFPSYPRLDWRQTNQWRLPANGKNVTLELHMPESLTDQIKGEGAWQMDDKSARNAQLSINNGQESFMLQTGKSIKLAGGVLHFIGVRGWMGYKLYFDPVLPWLFVIAVAGIGGLSWYFRALFKLEANSDARREEKIAFKHERSLTR